MAIARKDSIMDKNEIKSVLQTYFDACYECNGETMGSVFHIEAHIYGQGRDGTLTDWDRTSFMDMVDSCKPGTAIPGFSRLDEIISIDFTGENAAVARVKVRVMNMVYTDILSFLLLDGKWKIISKLFSGIPIV